MPCWKLSFDRKLFHILFSSGIPFVSIWDWAQRWLQCLSHLHIAHSLSHDHNFRSWKTCFHVPGTSALGFQKDYSTREKIRWNGKFSLSIFFSHNIKETSKHVTCCFIVQSAPKGSLVASLPHLVYYLKLVQVGIYTNLTLSHSI